MYARVFVHSTLYFIRMTFDGVEFINRSIVGKLIQEKHGEYDEGEWEDIKWYNEIVGKINSSLVLFRGKPIEYAKIHRLYAHKAKIRNLPLGWYEVQWFFDDVYGVFPLSAVSLAYLIYMDFCDGGRDVDVEGLMVYKENGEYVDLLSVARVIALLKQNTVYVAMQTKRTFVHQNPVFLRQVIIKTGKKMEKYVSNAVTYEPGGLKTLWYMDEKNEYMIFIDQEVVTTLMKTYSDQEVKLLIISTPITDWFLKRFKLINNID